MAFICLVCFWEIDLFIKSEDESSDQNHDLTLDQARKNFITFGAALPCLKKYYQKQQMRKDSKDYA